MKYELNGYNIDELIKTLHRKHFQIFNIVRRDVKNVEFEVSDSDAKKVKKYLLNFKVKQKATSIANRLRNFLYLNIGLLIACLVGVCFFAFSSSYIWQIKIYGNENLTQKEILRVLKNNGVSKGAKNLKSQKQIEDILLNNYNKLAQVSVSKVGTTILINISEKLIYEEVKYANLTAKHAGIVSSINVITGTSNVKVGDYVNVGDVLVLPFNFDSNGNKIFVQPIAEIKGEIYSITRTETPKHDKILIRSGRVLKSSKYYLKNKFLFENKSKKMFDIFETVVYNEDINRLIPLRRERVLCYELCEKVIEHDFDKEKQDIVKKCQDIAHDNRPFGDIVHEQTATMIVDNTLIVTTILTILGDFCA